MGSAKSPRDPAGDSPGRPKGAEVSLAAVVTGSETVIAASRERRVLLCKADEINFLSGPGKGVLLIKLDKSDRLLGVITATDDRDTLTVKTSMGGEQRLNTGRYKVTGRGGRGHEFVSRGQIVEVIVRAGAGAGAAWREVNRLTAHAASTMSRS